MESSRKHRPFTLGLGVLVGAFMLGCEKPPSTAPAPEDVPAQFAPPGACDPWPDCNKNGGGDDGDDGDEGGGVLFDFPDEETENGVQIADANHGDLFNDGGRWLEFGFDGNDGLPDVTFNYDDTEAAFDAGDCTARNTTDTVTPEFLAAFLVFDATTVFSGGVKVDKKGDEDSSSTEHRVGVQFDDPDSGDRILIALKGNLDFGPITVTGDASADPTDLEFTGGTVRVRDRSVGSSSKNNPILDCPHGDFVNVLVDRQ